MKKSLLFAVLGATLAFGATAAAPELTQTWKKSVEGATAEATYSAVTAVDAAGNVYAAGAYDKDFTLGTTALEAIGTSAYLAKYDATGAIAWAVGFTGSATVTAIDTDADGNIYVAGQLADEVAFGTTSGNAITKKGMEVDGAPTIKQNAAFVAKYDATGAVKAVETFVPTIYAGPASRIDVWDEDGYLYFYEDGDIFFTISDLKVEGEKLYLSAVYTGETTFGETKFSAPYAVFAWSMYADMAAASVFSLDTATIKNADILATLAAPVENGDDVEDSSEAWSARFDINDGKIFAAFAGSGNLKLNGQSVNEEGHAFIFATIDGETVNAKATAATAAAFYTKNSIAAVFYNGTDANVLGQVYTEEEVEIEVPVEGGEEGETETKEITVKHEDIFATSVAAATLTAEIKPFSSTDGDIAFNRISSAAALATGEIYVNTLGYYNKAGEEPATYKKDDFSGKTKSFVVADGKFEAAPVEAFAVAANGTNVAFANITETGADFSLYSTPAAGIADITAADADAPAVYYNLQGIRVANPANGIYVRVAAGKASKVLVK